MGSNTGFMIKVVAVTVIIPYLLGVMVSSRFNLDSVLIDLLSNGPNDNEVSSMNLNGNNSKTNDARITKEETTYGRYHHDGQCDDDLAEVIGSVFDDMKLVIHHNGIAEGCGQITDIQTTMENVLSTFTFCPTEYEKYDFESFLTRAIGSAFVTANNNSNDSDTNKASSTCSTPEYPGDEDYEDEIQEFASPFSGFFGFCDGGHHNTPILLDHGRLVKIPSSTSGEEEDTLPCHFHSREGLRITNFKQLIDLTKGPSNNSCTDDEEGETCTLTGKNELHLYAVPAGRVFHFAPAYVGEVFDLPRVEVDSGLPVSLKVMSLRPKVFEIYNFFDKDESQELIDRALQETREDYKIQRSTTGTSSATVYDKRTSENGFDTHGKTAQKVKRRCMNVLGFDEYVEGHTDGLQILRYNLTKAYIPHLDYLDDDGGRFDYESDGRGGNRYATILLYMTDLDEDGGGETVFPEAWPADVPKSERKRTKDVVQELRDSKLIPDEIKVDSWEENMVGQCRTRLSVRPNSARAILFYSQHPNGFVDSSSIHGGCPVLKGEKWAANLWVWNTPREGFDGAPVKEDWDGDGDGYEEPTNNPKQIKATFVNSGKDPIYENGVELYYDKSGDSWGELNWNSPPLIAYTYEGHKWDIKVNGEWTKQFTISSDDEEEQTFEI